LRALLERDQASRAQLSGLPRNKGRRKRSRVFAHFFDGNKEMSLPSPNRELAALRKLEQAVRACGLPGMMVSGQPQLNLLAQALREVSQARTETEATRAEARS